MSQSSASQKHPQWFRSAGSEDYMSLSIWRTEPVYLVVNGRMLPDFYEFLPSMKIANFCMAPYAEFNFWFSQSAMATFEN